MTTRDIRQALVMQAKLELARRNFFDYAALTAPDFYKREREFLVTMADELQQFFEHDNEHDVLVMNVPPRHGKSRTSSKFVEWLFGGNPQLKIMTASYNEILSKTFSKNIRNTISEQKVERDIVVYSDIFKNVRIKRGDGAMNLWSLEGQYANYLATSPGGTATGFGANCFPAGTLVHTDCGPVPIEEIKVGEHRALSWCGGDGLRYNNVAASRVKMADAIVRVEFSSGAAIECTPDHKVYVVGKGYVEVADMSVGDKVKEVVANASESMLYSLSSATVTHIETRSECIEVYDIQVDNDHNFFANGILVHNCVIIDDLIKNALEANNARVLEEHWEWFTNTMLSRLEADGKIIIIMTRWNSNDLAGRALKMLPEAGYKVKHINMKAVQDDGSMLCDDILSRREYDKKVSVMGEDIASANYQQEPIDLKGKLYNTLLVYDELPSAYDRIVSYCDTADDGKDYLSHIVALSTPTHDYVVDVVYTQAPMEETEKEVAASIAYYGADIEPMFESNNGGKMYARSVERILQEEYGLDIYVNWFHQTQNKQARILTHAPEVMRRVVFPSDWEERWPEFYKDVTTYQRTGKNAHDDAPDSLTGLVEYTTEKGGEITSGASPYGKRRF